MLCAVPLRGKGAASLIHQFLSEVGCEFILRAFLIPRMPACTQRCASKVCSCGSRKPLNNEPWVLSVRSPSVCEQGTSRVYHKDQRYLRAGYDELLPELIPGLKQDMQQAHSISILTNVTSQPTLVVPCRDFSLLWKATPCPGSSTEPYANKEELRKQST